MMQHIDYFKKNFDMIFFDTPPVLAVTDSSLLGTKVTVCCLLYGHIHTDREIAARAVNTIQNVGIKVLGVVFKRHQPHQQVRKLRLLQVLLSLLQIKNRLI